MRVLITGGCGFVGSNLANSLMADGCDVVLFDNLSRKGTEKNLKWLEETHGAKTNFVKGDIRDYDALAKVMNSFDAVYHTAGQVAVTTSVVDPREDFEINALGTFNVLEAIRNAKIDPAVIFTSTNKVYGGMEDVVVEEMGGRYGYRDFPQGMDESRPLDFHSPYGCSKGTADQYVRDYSRIYGMRNVVFRMSCQYGIRQFGNEDQGWVVHFVIAAHFGKDINIYGDGKQVRDMLFIEDLVRAFRMATDKIDDIKGDIFNIGSRNEIANMDITRQILALLGKPESLIRHVQDRPGHDRRYAVDAGRIETKLGWKPEIPFEEGLAATVEWYRNNPDWWRHIKSGEYLSYYEKQYGRRLSQ